MLANKHSNHRRRSIGSSPGNHKYSQANGGELANGDGRKRKRRLGMSAAAAYGTSWQYYFFSTGGIGVPGVPTGGMITGGMIIGVPGVAIGGIGSGGIGIFGSESGSFTPSGPFTGWGVGGGGTSIGGPFRGSSGIFRPVSGGGSIRRGV